MDKATKGVIIFLSRPMAPEHEAGVRIEGNKNAEITLSKGVEGLLNISRYELRPRPLPPDPEGRWRKADYIHMQKGQFATLYETSFGDPAAIRDSIQSVAPMLPKDAESIYEGFFETQVILHRDGFDARTPPKNNGILVAMTHPYPSEEEKYEEWYNPVHLEDERVHGVHHTITRFINRSKGAPPKSLSILETDWEDISEARQDILEKYVPHFRWPPHPVNEVFVASEYQRIF